MAGLILSSAALKIGGDVPRLLIALAPLLSRWLPHLRGTRLDPKLISRDPAQVAAYVNDPLVSLKAPPARTGAELLAAMEANRVAAAAGFARVPVPRRCRSPHRSGGQPRHPSRPGAAPTRPCACGRAAATKH
jgi:acylglycerol lipase